MGCGWDCGSSDHASPAPRRGLSEPKAKPSPGLSHPGMMDRTQETGVEGQRGQLSRGEQGEEGHGTEEGLDTDLQTRPSSRARGDTGLLSSSRPPAWKDRCFPRPAVLCSEGGRGRVRGARGGAAGSLVNTPLVFPPEGHPAELGDFQRQFLLTSQLSWASGLLIKLVNTTGAAGGRDPPMLPAAPFPSLTHPSPALLFSGLEHLSPVAASVALPRPGSLCVCRALSCPSLSLSVPVKGEGNRKPRQP